MLRQVWVDLKSYLGITLVDFFISASLWLSLYAFKLLTETLAIEGWAGELIVTVHSVSTALAFVVFGVLFIRHVWKRK